MSSFRHSMNSSRFGVPEAAVASDAVLDEHRASGVDEHRRPDRHRFERQQRQALVRRRADDDCRGLERLHAFAVGQHAGKADDGSSGSDISFAPISASVASPPSLT